jgi:hypothetical protein
LQSLKERVIADKKLAAKLSKEGNKEDALIVLKRAKIMEKEIEETESTESPGFPEIPLGPVGTGFPSVPSDFPR